MFVIKKGKCGRFIYFATLLRFLKDIYYFRAISAPFW